MREVGSLVLLGVLVGGLLEGCGGGGNDGGKAARFTTSVPADKPLGGLSGDELGTLCADGERFAAQPSVRADSCRVAAYFTVAFSAAFTPDATDADLRTQCTQSYDACITPSPDGGAGGGDTGSAMCTPAPANCTATVGEYTACINDSTAQTHDFASSVPDCGSVSRAGLTSAGGGTSPTLTGEPASCVTVDMKCSGLSDQVQAFADQYCALVGPCCTQAGSTSQCTAAVYSAARGMTYDETAGAACLQDLQQRQSGTALCDGLALVTSGSSSSWAVTPACAAVFQVRGTTPPGGACNQDADCEPAADGGAACVFGSFLGGGGDPSTTVCLQTTATLSQPCVATVITNFGISGVSDPPAQGVLCDQARGAMCDRVTHMCVPVHGLGEPCSAVEECDNVTTYCDFQTCAARRPVGASCEGSLLAECDGTAYCSPTTQMCVAAGGKGAACSTTASFLGECLSGFCNNGACTDPLTPLCQ